jgi:hypothetical protein
MKAMLVLATSVSMGLTAASAYSQSASDVGEPRAEAPPPAPLLPEQWYRPVLAMAYAAAPPVAYFGSEAVDSYWPVVPAMFFAPSVHWASRRGWRAGISLVMQPVAAYTGWMLGIAATRPACSQKVQSDCGHDDAATGILVGYLTWAVADVVLVSDVRPRPMDEQLPQPVVRRTRVRVTPVATVTPSGQLVGGLAGRF